MRCVSNLSGLLVVCTSWELKLECGVRLRVWDTGRKWHYLVCCRRGRWLGAVLATCERDRTALADDGPASPGNGNHGLALGIVMILSGVKRRCYSSWYGLAVRLDEWWCARSTRHCGRAVGHWSLSWCFLVDVSSCSMPMLSEWMTLWLKPWPFYMVLLVSSVLPLVGWQV